MIVSKIASRIYQTAKSAAKGAWNWRLEWSMAMKKAWREVMNIAPCTKEIWNQAASLHVRGQAGLVAIVREVAQELGTTDFQEVANHLYGRFQKAKKNDRTGHYTFGLYLNQMFDKYCK